VPHESPQSSQAASNSQVPDVSSTTASYQPMQDMYNKSDSQPNTEVASPGPSRLLAEDSPVEVLQSEPSAPTADNPPPPVPLPVGLFAVGWHEGFCLISALDSLNSYQPLYITTSGQSHIIFAQCTPAVCPNTFVPDAKFEMLVDHIEIVCPMLGKLYDTVIFGVRALMDIQEESEKLKAVNFGSEGRET
jgi:hypothetical protein